MISAKDICWAAGLYEGEGTCNKNANTQMVEIYQKDPWVLHRLASLFGGTVKPKRRYGNGFGTDGNVWRIYGPRARGFLETMFVLLSPRRQEQIKKIGTFDVGFKVRGFHVAKEKQ